MSLFEKSEKEQIDLKIAMICTEKLPVPPVAGGAVQLYIDEILPYLSQKHDITVFCIRHPGLPDREKTENAEFIRLPGLTDTIYVDCLKENLDNSYDLIHVLNRPRWVLALAENLPDVRFSLSLHNEMFHKTKISDSDGEKCIRRVEFINTVSDFIAKGVKYRFPFSEEKLRVVYSGANPQKYFTNWSQEGLLNKAELKERLGLQDYRIVLSVGRLSVKKGVHVLLRAMKDVADSYPRTALVVVGSKWYGKNESDEYTRSLQAIADSIPGPVRFTGFIPPSEIPPYYNMGDVFICASQWNEPLARVHYEAMAAGLPIITTDRGGNPEVVEGLGNGIVLEDCKDHLQMAENIKYILNNPAAAAEMGKKGRMLVEEKFNWKRVADEVFEGIV